MDDLLHKLLEVPGVPGYESRVRDLIEARLPAAVARETDALGNLVATIGQAETPALMFVAHMDEIGFVVADVREDGFLKLKALGGIDPRTVFGRCLRVITEKGEVRGVIAVKPPHLMSDRATEMRECPPVGEFVVDIGVRSGAEAAALGVKVLDFAVIEKHPATLANGLLCARALDDRAGCWILLRALERLAEDPPAGRIHFGFSVQEEVGLRGAARLARSHRLDYAFAVDSVSSADWPGVARELSPALVGAGPCLRVLDNATVVPTAFRNEVQAVAGAAGIPLQIVFSGGGTDAKPFQAEGPQVISLAFPVRYTHSAVELVSPDDLDGCVELLCALAHHYAGN